MKIDLAKFKEWATTHKKGIRNGAIAACGIACAGTAVYFLNASEHVNYEGLKKIFDFSKTFNAVKDIRIDPKYADKIDELWVDGTSTTAIMQNLKFEEVQEYLEYFKSVEEDPDNKLVNIIIGFVPKKC